MAAANFSQEFQWRLTMKAKSNFETILILSVICVICVDNYRQIDFGYVSNDRYLCVDLPVFCVFVKKKNETILVLSVICVISVDFKGFLRIFIDR